LDGATGAGTNAATAIITNKASKTSQSLFISLLLLQ
jgi:hypothetical protein